MIFYYEKTNHFLFKLTNILIINMIFLLKKNKITLFYKIMVYYSIITGKLITEDY